MIDKELDKELYYLSFRIKGYQKSIKKLSGVEKEYFKADLEKCKRLHNWLSELKELRSGKGII